MIFISIFNLIFIIDLIYKDFNKEFSFSMMIITESFVVNLSLWGMM